MHTYCTNAVKLCPCTVDLYRHTAELHPHKHGGPIFTHAAPSWICRAPIAATTTDGAPSSRALLAKSQPRREGHRLL
eukprot:366260-Chlamydomonas_euryale.AAC.40